MNLKDCDISFLEVFEALINPKTEQKLELIDSNSYGSEERIVSRGLPKEKLKGQRELSLQILKKQKRNTLLRNIELLKNLIQQKEEEETLIHLAKIINEVTTKEQKLLFIREIELDEKRHDYIPTVSYGRMYRNEPDYKNYNCIVSRSAAPENEKDISLSSINTNSIGNSHSLAKSSPGEQYLIHKGIHYCRVLLSKFFHQRDNTIIRELKSRDILDCVLNEQIDNQKSYLMNFVDQYPTSYQEIFFILKEDEESILRSPIFVLLAEKNMNQLYEFLSRLSTDRVDKDKLSQFCDESNFNGALVSHVIRKNKKPEDAISCVKIETFLNRYKKLQKS